jgi:hypothetical protein
MPTWRRREPVQQHRRRQRWHQGRAPRRRSRVHIVGQQAILDYLVANYDTAKFVAAYGPIADRPAYRVGSWWTGDEDMDWLAEFNDVGADGVKDTHDAGEGDGIPTEGEPNFDRTDLNESDQIGLTGFKYNKIKAGQGTRSPTRTASCSTRTPRPGRRSCIASG